MDPLAGFAQVGERGRLLANVAANVAALTPSTFLLPPSSLFLKVVGTKSQLGARRPPGPEESAEIAIDHRDKDLSKIKTDN